MYGLLTKCGAGAVLSAGLSVLGVTYLCTDVPTNHQHHRPAAVVAVQADAALGAGGGVAVGARTGQWQCRTRDLGERQPRRQRRRERQPRHQQPGRHPGSSSNPGTSHPAPDCGCTTNNPPLINVKPDVDVDVDVVVKLPDTDLNAPGLVGGVLGTVGTVVDVVLPDCGCSSAGPPALLPLPVLGH